MKTNNWVFLRGLTRGNAHWAHFPEVFKNDHPEVQTDFLEIPGNGSLNKESTPLFANQVIDILRKRCKFVESKQKFNLCGISLGGMVALKWAEIFPEEIDSVTVINSSLRQLSPMHRRLNVEYYGKIIRTLLNSNTHEQEKVILSITSNKFNETQKNLTAFTEFSSKHPVSKINFIRQLLLANSIRINSDKNLKVPVKIINSQNDRLVHHSCSDKITQFLKGQQIVHTTAGHDLPLDEPEWLSSALFK